MEFVQFCIDFVFHIDTHLGAIIQHFGVWSYALLFLIIFAETGFVVTPFLPGDSLLFAAGTFAAVGSFNLWWLMAALILAAIIGDSVNYAAGKLIGEKAFQGNHSRIFKKEYLERTHRFYEKYGGKTIVLARFVPIVRTFAPFVAGVGRMNYLHFLVYNVTGGILWVLLFTVTGFWFGNMPVIRENFSLTIFIIIILSLMPGLIEYWKHHKAHSKRRVQ